MLVNRDGVNGLDASSVNVLLYSLRHSVALIMLSFIEAHSPRIENEMNSREAIIDSLAVNDLLQLARSLTPAST